MDKQNVERWGWWSSNGTELVWGDDKVLEMQGGDGSTIVGTYLIQLNVTHKINTIDFNHK